MMNTVGTTSDRRSDKTELSNFDVTPQFKLNLLKEFSYVLTSCGSTFHSSFKEQMECFIRTANCTPVKDQTVCMNPTLMKMKIDGRLVVNIASCPFEAYFPIPFNEQIEESDSSVPVISNDTYYYCKEKVGLLLSAFLQRKKRAEFCFHFGDCLELCLYKDYMKEKFHVIFCSPEIVKDAALANNIPAASVCLNAESDTSVLLTNSRLSNLKQIYLNEVQSPKLSTVEYIESALSCPLSMIPTLFGMKLPNHLKLGSQVCVNMHDNIIKHYLTLKWLKAPAYSLNIPLDISSSLKDAIGELAKTRFDALINVNPFQNRLRTHYFIIQSIINRCRLLQDGPALRHLIQTQVLTVVSRDMHLIWRAEQAWMNGEQVLAHFFSSNWIRNLRTQMLEEKKWRLNTPLPLMLTALSEYTGNEYTSPIGHGQLKMFDGLMDKSHNIRFWSSRREKERGSYFLTSSKRFFGSFFQFSAPQRPRTWFKYLHTRWQHGIRQSTRFFCSRCTSSQVLNL